MIALLAAALVIIPAPIYAADNEAAQIAILTSATTSPQEKDNACQSLKRIGTAQSVPALAALLADEKLSPAARNALETMPGAEAGQALIAALDKTTGLTQVGIIQSLGYRREVAGATALAARLNNPDEAIATAAAATLGKIGGADALQALQNRLPNAKGLQTSAIWDSLLAIGWQRLNTGDAPGAKAVFQAFSKYETPAHIQEAAYGGLIRAAGNEALNLIVAGLKGSDSAQQRAAMQQARTVADSKATAALTQLLPELSPVLQTALIEALGQRDDPTVAPAILALAQSSKESTVRVAAYNVLGMIGNASAVPVLVAGAADPDKAAQKTARQALLLLPGIDEALVMQLASSTPAGQAEIIRALGSRSVAGNPEKLLGIAKSGPDSARLLALRALTPLATSKDLPQLVSLLVETKSDTLRPAAQEALISIVQRLQGKPGFDANPIVSGVRQGQPADRIALLPVAATLTGENARAALRAAAQDSDATIKTAALRALCDARDTELLPDLLALARTATEANVRALAMRGASRLATEEETHPLSATKRLETLRELQSIAKSDDEKRLVLAGLATLPDTNALALVLPALAVDATREEAAQAVLRITPGTLGVAPELSRDALKKVVPIASPSQRQTAEALLKQLDDQASYLVVWRVAGAYRQDGKDYAALFDLPLGPEIQGKEVSWRNLPSGTNPQQPWVMDLLKLLGGEQCVAYVETRIYSEKEQPARLELGSDDGVKAWLNGAQVHANNIARPLTADSDKVNLQLKAGQNVLRLKITQNNLGWEFRARLSKPDGSALEGVKTNIRAD